MAREGELSWDIAVRFDGGDYVREIFPLTPQGIISHLRLRRPIFRKTAFGGHFGRNDPDFTWEATDKAAELRAAAGLTGSVPAPSFVVT